MILRNKCALITGLLISALCIGGCGKTISKSDGSAMINDAGAALSQYNYLSAYVYIAGGFDVTSDDITSSVELSSTSQVLSDADTVHTVNEYTVNTDGNENAATTDIWYNNANGNVNTYENSDSGWIKSTSTAIPQIMKLANVNANALTDMTTSKDESNCDVVSGKMKAVDISNMIGFTLGDMFGSSFDILNDLSDDMQYDVAFQFYENGALAGITLNLAEVDATDNVHIHEMMIRVSIVEMAQSKEVTVPSDVMGSDIVSETQTEVKPVFEDGISHTNDKLSSGFEMMSTGNVRIDNRTLTMPMKLISLLEQGWSVNDTELETVAAGVTLTTNVVGNGGSLDVTVYNPTDSDLSVKQCNVMSLVDSSVSNHMISIEDARFEIGSSYDDIKQAFGEPNIEYTNADGKQAYAKYFVDSKSNYVIFECDENNNVTKITVAISK